MVRRTTMKEIATEVGTSVMTVSKVLRGIGSISPSMRERVLQTAEKLNYSPDPVMQAMVAYRTARQRTGRWNTLGVISSFSGTQPLKRNPFNIRLLRGVQEQAKTMGFSIDDKEVVSGMDEMKRSLKSFYRRGIQGILLLPPDNDSIPPWVGKEKEELNKLFCTFSVVSCHAHSLETPFSNVYADTFFNSRLACRMLKKNGYKRIGFTLEASSHNLNAGSFLAGYLIESLEDPDIPTPILPRIVSHYSSDDFTDWYKNEKLDCCLTLPGKLLSYLRMRSDKKKQYRLCSLSSGSGYWNTGVDSRAAHIGEEAVKLLAQQLALGIKGIPDSVLTVSIRGSWNQGSTA